MNKDLTVGKPSQVLWQFCLPMFGSIIFQQLYNIADSLVAGKFIGENALAAVGNSYEITLIFIAFAFGCNIGCSVIVSRYFGAKDYDEMKTSVYTSLIGSAVLCAVLMLIGLVGCHSLLELINTFGASVIAGYSAAVKLNNMVITSFTTLGNGISNYTSQNMGAGKMDRVHKGFGAGRNLVWIICVPIVLLYFFFGRFLLLLFMNDPQGPAIDTGMLFLRILSPFYFVVSLKLVTDGILRGCGMMVRFMIATFSDLILRVGIAIVLSSTALGSTGIWMAWPVGWCIGTGLSLVFYFTAIRKILAESPAKAEAEGKAAEARAEAEFAADAEMETL